jgi:hypothetical protein
LSVEPERKLRDEAVHELTNGVQARPTYAVVGEWRDWYAGYLQSNMEWSDPEGKTHRSRLQNSYQPKYGKRYYAKLKDFERGMERRDANITTAMLTFTASTLNADGHARCPADHMRDIQQGYDAARKQVHELLSGVDWHYCRVWEPHESGYGHLHMGIFIEGDEEIEADDFAPVMRSHVNNCDPAGWDAHYPSSDAVSVNDDVENLGTYISEYIGVFGSDPLTRPLTEQMFYATCWSTETQRVTFANSAQDVMRDEQFRRETGLRPEDRGDTESDEKAGESGAESEEGTGWSVDAICTVPGTVPEYADPTTGGTDTTVIDGRPGMDPPPRRE